MKAVARDDSLFDGSTDFCTGKILHRNRTSLFSKKQGSDMKFFVLPTSLAWSFYETKSNHSKNLTMAATPICGCQFRVPRGRNSLERLVYTPCLFQDEPDEHKNG